MISHHVNLTLRCLLFLNKFFININPCPSCRFESSNVQIFLKMIVLREMFLCSLDTAEGGTKISLELFVLPHEAGALLLAFHLRDFLRYSIQFPLLRVRGGQHGGTFSSSH